MPDVADRVVCKSDALRTLDGMAARRRGLVLWRELRDLFSARQVERMVNTGRLVAMRRGVYRCAGVPVTWELCVLAAILAAGSDAAASFRTAAYIWGLRYCGRPDLIELTVPAPRWVRLPGVRCHRTGKLRPGHVRIVRGIPVLSVARTIVDLSWVVPMTVLERIVDDALRRGLLTIEELRRVYEDVCGKGHRKTTVVRAILLARLPGYAPGGSDLENRVLRWVEQAARPHRIERQHPVVVGGRRRHLDGAIVDLRIAIEVKGFDPHGTMRTVFDDDAVRENELELAGWLVLRFTARATRAQVRDAVVRAIAVREKTGVSGRAAASGGRETAG
jgi:very-short-patch-repair endonuclease